MYNDSFQQMREECIAYSRNKNSALIERWCNEAGVTSPVGYYNNLGDRTMTIYTDKPGWLIGKGGCLVDKFTKQLCEEFFAKEYHVKFIEIRGGFANVK